jgi:hypothetical protein
VRHDVLDPSLVRVKIKSGRRTAAGSSVPTSRRSWGAYQLGQNDAESIQTARIDAGVAT